MKRILTFFFVLAIVVSTLGDGPDEEEKLCIKERRRALVSIKKNTEACRDAMVTTDKEGNDKGPADGCLIKCVLNKLKALESDGTVTQASFEAAMENRATGQRRERILKTFSDCHENFAAGINTEENEACPGYTEFASCLQKGIEEICDPEPHDGTKDEL